MLYYTYGDPTNEKAYREDNELDSAIEEAEQAVEDMRRLERSIDNSPLTEAETLSLLDALENIDLPNTDSDDSEDILDDIVRFNEEITVIAQRFIFALYGGGAE